MGPSKRKKLPKLRTEAKTGGRGRFALESIGRDEAIIEFHHESLLASPTRRSVQLDEGKHLHGRLRSVGLLNHSCEPNSWVDVKTNCVRATRNIAKGEEITFNYLTTEYDMHDGFQCRCGSARCYESIRGFKHLSREQQLALKPYLTPYLSRKLKTARKRTAPLAAR
jgi:SET domain-containing protein